MKDAELDKSHRLDAIVSLGRGLAAGLDRAEQAGATGYELAQLGKMYSDHLRSVGLMPSVQLSGSDGPERDPLDFGGPE